MSSIPHTHPSEYPRGLRQPDAGSCEHGPVQAGPPLTQDQRNRAWQSAFTYSLDLHPDQEIAWERDQWRELGASAIADLCDSLLSERRTDDFTIPGKVTPDDLTTLWRRVPRKDVLDLVRAGGQCLLAAVRLTFWLSLTPEEIAA